jgi:hypothetical protein
LNEEAQKIWINPLLVVGSLPERLNKLGGSLFGFYPIPLFLSAQELRQLQATARL